MREMGPDLPREGSLFGGHVPTHFPLKSTVGCVYVYEKASVPKHKGLSGGSDTFYRYHCCNNLLLVHTSFHCRHQLVARFRLLVDCRLISLSNVSFILGVNST